MEREFVYDAFISYRYANPDKAIAVKLQKLLEKYNPPASIKSGTGTKKLHIFRDETELSPGSNLSDKIKTALENSRFLIVICSKKLPQSDWCIQEINYFKELHGGSTDKIITVLTEGDPSEGFPDVLCTETRTVREKDGSVHCETINIEPLVANISAATEKESLKKLQRGYLPIAAPLLNCDSLDDLYKRHQKRLIRRIITIAASLVLFLAGFGTYSSAMAYQISTQRDQLEQKTTELESKTVELNETNTELTQKNDELDSANFQLEQTNDDLEKTNVDLAAKTAEAEENLVYANAQKAEAEKNLEYANQQKAEAERNLEYANQQKSEAEKNLVYANEQKELAEISEASTKKANHELRVKSSDILTTQAQMYLNDGDVINAIKAAIEALPVDENDDLPVNTTAEYLLSQAMSAYSDSPVMVSNFIDTSGYIAGMKYSEDGSKLLAYDSTNNIYLIDVDSDKVLKTYSVVNDFHIVGSSSKIKDVVMENDYAYILYSGGLACINLIDKTVEWHGSGFSLANMIKTNHSSDIIVVKAIDGIYFINKNGSLLEEFSHYKDSDSYLSLGDDISPSRLDENVAFVDENGCLYICTDFSSDSKQSLLLIDPHKKTVNTYGLNLSELLFMAELDGNIVISGRNSYYEGKIVCYNKSDLSLKWETEYDCKEALLSQYRFNRIFRHDYVELLPGEEVRDVVFVISGASIASVDYKTGELLTSYKAPTEIKGLCYESRVGVVGFGTSGVYNYYLYEHESDNADKMLSFRFDDTIEHIAYGAEDEFAGDKFAFAGRNSSRIGTYREIPSGNKSVEFVGSGSYGFKFYTENGCGVIAYFNRSFFARLSENKINSVRIYDTDKNEETAEIFFEADNDVMYLKFINTDNLVVCDSEGVMYLYDVRGRLLDNIDFRGEKIADNFQLSNSYFSFYDPSVLVSNRGDRFICRTSSHIIFVEILENTLHVDDIIYFTGMCDFSRYLAETNWGVIAYEERMFIDNEQGDTEYLHSKIEYFDMNKDSFYVLDGENDFTYNWDDLSNLLISKAGFARKYSGFSIQDSE